MACLAMGAVLAIGCSIGRPGDSDRVSAPAVSFAPGLNDPGGVARLFNAIVSAQASGADVSGTIDLTRIGTGNGISFQAGPNGGFPTAHET